MVDIIGRACRRTPGDPRKEVGQLLLVHALKIAFGAARPILDTHKHASVKSAISF